MASPSFPFRESSVGDRPHPQTALDSASSIDWATGLTTAALVTGLVGLRWSQTWVERWGEWSEELFRGDRLPLLPALPAATPPAEASSPTPSSHASA